MGIHIRQTRFVEIQYPSAITVASGSNGATLPISGGVLNVSSTVGYPTSGSLLVNTVSSGTQPIDYTGIVGNTFTGCTGGTGTLATGGLIQYSVPRSIQLTNQDEFVMIACSGSSANPFVNIYTPQTPTPGQEITISKLASPYSQTNIKVVASSYKFSNTASYSPFPGTTLSFNATTNVASDIHLTFTYLPGIQQQVQAGTGNLVTHNFLVDPSQPPGIDPGLDNFQNMGVIAGDLVWIKTGLNAGQKRRIINVSGNSLTTEAFPSTDTGFSYEVIYNNPGMWWVLGIY